MELKTVIEKRASIRAFLSKSVEPDCLHELLDRARWAPSDKNTQPWLLAVLTGVSRDRMSAALVAAHDRGQEPHPDFPIESLLAGSIYKDRAFKCGMDLYAALGIERSDKERRLAQWRSNFEFFNAPVVIFFFVDQNQGVKACVDTALFIENFMLLAVDAGLGTCAQGALSFYPSVVKAQLGEEFHDKKLLCGLSLGYPDWTAPENNYRTERAAVEDFTRFFI